MKIYLILISILFIIFACEKFCQKSHNGARTLASKMEVAYKCNPDKVYGDMVGLLDKTLCKNYPEPTRIVPGASLVCNLVLDYALKAGATWLAGKWECKDVEKMQKDFSFPAKFCSLIDIL